MSSTEGLITGVDFAMVPTRAFDEAIAFYGESLGLRRSVYRPDRGFADRWRSYRDLADWRAARGVRRAACGVRRALMVARGGRAAPDSGGGGRGRGESYFERARAHLEAG